MRAVGMLGSLGLGAALMYVFDPRSGRRRRSVLGDQITHAFKVESRLMGKARRDLEHRAQGIVHEISEPTSQDVPAEVLIERVRATIGHVVSHPRAIEVEANNGVVVLRGPILEGEAPQLLAFVERVPGVREVVDQLERHATADSVPSLQGPASTPSEEMKERLSPGPRVLVGGIGALLTVAGDLRGGVTGAIVKTGGVSLLVRAIANRRFGEIIGLKPARIELEKTLTIHAPIERVFALWTRLDAFPLFMEHVRSVEMSANDPQRSTWVVDGPLGLPTTFEARVTQLQKNRFLAWSTLPDSVVSHHGTIRFEEVEGGTRLQIQLSYEPPGGVLGAAIARVLGWDPKSRMDDDLVRAKTLLEKGLTTAHHKRVTIEQLPVTEATGSR
ncbi:MAG: hypothetical protein JWO36_6168 [Myxococcales bacterium]|nr:hypothetical protein [Myxococcales bacterium]